MNIYELTKEFTQLLQEIDDYALMNGGEIPDELAIRFEVIEKGRIERLTYFAKAIFNARAQAAAINEEIDRLAGRRDWIEKQEQRLEWLLDRTLLPGEKIENEVCTISRRKSEAVEVENEHELPEAFWTVRQVRTPNKAEIKDTLKTGGEVPGARLVVRQHLQVK